MMSAPVDVGSLHSASSSRQPPSRPRGCHVPRSTQTCRRCWRPPPRRFTAVGRASPFQKAGRLGKSPVPAFAVKIIDKSPGMASHDDEQQHQQLPPPLHPSSWRLADGPSKRTKGEGGGAGKPAEFQISRTGLASSPPFLQNSSRWRRSVRRGEKRGDIPTAGVLFHNPRRPTCLGTSLLLGRCLQLHAVILLDPANRWRTKPKPSSPRKPPVRKVATINRGF